MGITSEDMMNCFIGNMCQFYTTSFADVDALLHHLPSAIGVIAIYQSRFNTNVTVLNQSRLVNPVQEIECAFNRFTCDRLEASDTYVYYPYDASYLYSKNVQLTSDDESAYNIAVATEHWLVLEFLLEQMRIVVDHYTKTNDKTLKNVQHVYDWVKENCEHRHGLVLDTMARRARTAGVISRQQSDRIMREFIKKHELNS